jgi:hypothetical protein
MDALLLEVALEVSACPENAEHKILIVRDLPEDFSAIEKSPCLPDNSIPHLTTRLLHRLGSLMAAGLSSVCGV